MDGDATIIESSKLLSVIAELLSTKTDAVEKALLYRTVATGRDVIDKQHTDQEASYGRDAFAKVISLKVRLSCNNDLYIVQNTSLMVCLPVMVTFHNLLLVSSA